MAPHYRTGHNAAPCIKWFELAAAFATDGARANLRLFIAIARTVAA